MSMPVHAVFFLLCTSCCVWGCPQNAPPCTQADLAKIEADYQAELVAKCIAQGASCSEKPAIDDKYRKLREGWVKCDSGSAPAH